MTNTLFDQVRALITEHHLMAQMILRAKLDLIIPFVLAVLLGIGGALLRRKALATEDAYDRPAWSLAAVACGVLSIVLAIVAGTELIAIFATPEACVLRDLLKK